MARILVTGSADGLGRPRPKPCSATVTRSSSTPAAPSGWPPSNRSSPGRGSRRRRPRRPRPDPQRSPTRSTGSGRSTPSSTTPASTAARRSWRSTSSPRTCSPRSSSRRSGSCTSAAACTAADEPTSTTSTGRPTRERLYCDSKLLRDHPRRRHGPPLARRLQQRRRPRLGADPDGRARTPPTTSGSATSPRCGSPRATTPRRDQRRLLVPPATPQPHRAVLDTGFQDQLLATLRDFTGAPAPAQH